MYNPTGLPVPLQGCTLTQTPDQDASHNLSPVSQVLCFYTIYLSRDSTAQRVCSPGVGFNPPEFLSSCGIPVSCCLATSVVRSLGGAWVVFPRPGSSWLWEAWKRYSYRPPFRDLGVRGASIVRMWTLVFGWPQLGLISPLWFLSWSRYILGSGVALN